MVSLEMMEVLRNHSPKIQEYSIDGAFLDFTGVSPSQLEKHGHDIKNDLMETLKIPVCVGFAKTKTLAKFANHLAKTYEDLNSVYSFHDHERLRASLGLFSIDQIWGICAAKAHERESNF